MTGGFLYGNSNITISGSPIIEGDIYGSGRGYNYSSLPNLAGMEGISTINISGSPTINGRIFGAGAGVSGYGEMAKLVGNSNVNISSNLSSEVYGGGNIAKTEGNTIVNINSGNHLQAIYGGGNDGEIVGDTEVNINGGSNTLVYGGGNRAEVENSIVNIKNGTNTDVFAGGNQAKVITTTTNITGGNSTNVYAGGNSADVETTDVLVNGGNTVTIYGGSNQTGTVNKTNIETQSGTVGTIYGGNNIGGTTQDANITINGGSITSAVYGGGNQVDTNKTTIILRKSDNQIPAVYGGGNEAGVPETYIYGEGANVKDLFGGSNSSGTVNITTVEINSGNYENIYGGNNIGGTTQDANVAINGGSITSAVYGGGNQVDTNKTTIILRKSDNQIPAVYGGGNEAGVPETYIYGEGANVKDLFGGSNSSGTVNVTTVEINSGNYENVYGGNNLGGICKTPYVTINGGTTTNVYGGGNKVSTYITNVNVHGQVLQSVYGGGNEAGVETDTNVYLFNANVGDNVYGGGNEGTVAGNTNVHVKDSIIGNSLYAGGNGETATVYGTTNLIMDGTKNNIAQNVFGGGNKGQTGTETNHTSSNVKIVGGTVGGNVYGGANTSVVYGTTSTKIGYDAVGDNSLEIGDINIVGTIFGGGEANAEGDEEYDFSFISVTDGIDILIDGNKHENFITTGSIFGSGNASSTSGKSYITIKNYGTPDEPQMNISLQRANLVTIINSSISLSGATDRTNEYATTFFSISRVDEVKLKNNSVLYLQNGANLLTKLSSVVDDENGNEQKGYATINEDTGETVKNVDNRIYMLEGRNLNVATNEQVTTYGEVSGMFFFGVFTSRNSPSTSTGLYYYGYNNGDTIINEGVFTANAYVLGQHMANHNIKVDGFYTNYNSEGTIKANYITPTPENDAYYMWIAGEAEEATTINVELAASKYITLGTAEVLLQGFSTPNVKYIVTGFSSGLMNGVELVDPSEINPIEQDEDKANNLLGLTIESGTTGWQTKGKTTFLTENGGIYTGTTDYDKDNTSYAPTFNICLYHSQNISEKRALGDVTIRLQVLTPIDDLKYDISWINIIVTISSNLFQDDFYEGAITPGQKFGLFTSTDTTITSKSDFSAYFSHTFSIDQIDEEDKEDYKYYDKFFEYRRALVSTDANGNAYSFPENTKITMLDMVTNKYYYYIVTADDVVQNKYVYYLEDFIIMGSENGQYNEIEESKNYYLQDQNTYYENFIFHVSFADTNIEQNVVNNSLLMELRNTEGQTLVSVIGIQRDVLKYSVYPNQDATIDVEGEVIPETIYLGNQADLNVTTKFTQTIVEGKRVYDTQYFDKKLGIKISIYDTEGNRLGIDSLLGVNFELDGQKYYPRVDRNNKNKYSR